jgi:hypothetical protein
MANLSPEDYHLSMAISPRGKIDPGELRSLLIHRLSDTDKAVLRRPLRQSGFGIYCEPCSRWTKIGDEAPQEFTCFGCDTLYRVEFAIYEAINREEIE